MPEKKEIEQENKINEENKSNQLLEDKKPKKIKKSLKQILNEAFKGISKVAFTSAVTGISAYVLFGHSNAVQEKIIQKCAENPGYISGLIQNTLSNPFGYYSSAAVTLTAAFYASEVIAENLNPVYNIPNFYINGVRDFMGEILIAPFKPTSKWRKKITSPGTYKLNIERDKRIMGIRKEKLENKMDKLQTRIGNLQTKINELQKLKIGYQDKIVENPELYENKIKDVNKEMEELYARKETLQSCAA